MDHGDQLGIRMKGARYVTEQVGPIVDIATKKSKREIDYCHQVIAITMREEVCQDEVGQKSFSVYGCVNAIKWVLLRVRSKRWWGRLHDLKDINAGKLTEYVRVSAMLIDEQVADMWSVPYTWW